MITKIVLRQGGFIEISDDPTWTRVTLLTSTLPNGDKKGTASVYGEPREDQQDTAVQFGYGAEPISIPALCRDHDPLHALLADILGLRASYSMRYATGLLQSEEVPTSVLEEHAVVALQKYICNLGLTVAEIARRNGYEVTQESNSNDDQGGGK